jgi:hypothetical protein
MLSVAEVRSRSTNPVRAQRLTIIIAITLKYLASVYSAYFDFFIKTADETATKPIKKVKD